MIDTTMDNIRSRFRVSGFRCQEISVFGIRFSVLDTDTFYETTHKRRFQVSGVRCQDKVT
ncbi:hypothetical protein D1AOALGA4SA_8327 [Olavius algarvensis Delta 1 endosymbiont]|nr:hypothetical protein D1AOALGA4SA_8327 [Olavius algarvensis Delta 1 endosymbiont]